MLRLALACLLTLAATTASAQDRRISHCIAIANADPGIEFIQRASWKAPLPDEFTVRLTYIDHSMFLLQTSGGLNAITDYNGFIGAVTKVPDIVTMNNAHGTHWTAVPNTNIPHVLEGWRQEGLPADHNLDLGEMLVRNVTTDIRDRFDAITRVKDGNSIFVFEAGGLCIGHLGHLHHEPNDQQYAALGRLDVVMAAIDGGLTVDTPTMIRIVKRLKSSIVLPMHWFSRGSLEVFLAGVSDDFAIDRTKETSLEVSLRTLPSRPTVVVLEPRFLTMEN
ncbi:MBL fold metallo-hydrolase [uncultured Boseongicola sp.]|uniref:MBL fold metallo-hydrolase n=1 Tax=uncultured Boseongicola sp. TaxID=1648499 RepID=UPI0026021FE5|nr:MBL fold metallo-hydrolase [uncultured Boseongicola sp.]